VADSTEAQTDSCDDSSGSYRSKNDPTALGRGSDVGPNQVIVNKDSIGPELHKSAVIGRQSGKNCSLAMGHVGSCATVGNDSVL
jgi:hypothetical protein